VTLGLLTRIANHLWMIFPITRQFILTNDSMNNGKSRVTQSTVPSSQGWFDNNVSFTPSLGERIETPSTLAFQNSSPPGLILDQEKVWVKFK
jgi:hypothetical protein